jgi:hypothetical protein
LAIGGMIRFIVPSYMLVTAVMAATFLIIVVHFGAKSQKIYKPNAFLPYCPRLLLAGLFDRYTSQQNPKKSAKTKLIHFRRI